MKKLNFGENLRFIRQDKGINQEAMAFHLNISQATYSRIERQSTPVNREQLDEIAKILSVTITELLIQEQHHIQELDNTHKPEPKSMQVVKEIVNTPIGLIIFLGASSLLVCAVYDFAQGVCDGFGTKEMLRTAVSFAAAFSTMAYIYYFVKKVKRLG